MKLLRLESVYFERVYFSVACCSVMDPVRAAYAALDEAKRLGPKDKDRRGKLIEE